MKYAFIKENLGEFNLAALSRTLGVSRSGYYAWLHRKPGEKAQQQARCDTRVREQFQEHDHCYGAPRLQVELSEQGHHYDVKTIANSLKRQGLCAVAGQKFQPKTTDSNHALPVYPNVLGQDFKADAPNRKWVQDITYTRTDEGWLYLAVVIDLYSRLVVGWAMSPRIDAQLVCEALQNALLRRGKPRGVILHSDRGSQYCSHDYRDLIKQYGLTGSMSAKGYCYDNACAESFFHSLKVEKLHRYRFETHQQMRQAVFQYIEVNYNRKRRHSACGYLSPLHYEYRRAA